MGDVLDEGGGVFVDPADFSFDHLEESEAFHAAEETGGGDGEDGLCDHGFDHEPGDGLEFREGDDVDFVVAADEAFEAGFVEVFGPCGGVVGTAEDGELERAVGDVDDALLEPGGVVVDDGNDFAVAEKDIARVPIAVDDLDGPIVESHGGDFFGGFGVGVAEEGDGGGELSGGGVVRALQSVEGGGDLVEAGVDGAGVVVGADGRFEFGFVFAEELVVEAEDFSGVEGGFEGGVVGVATDVFEEFVDLAIVLEHGVVVFAGADEMGERELFFGEEELEGVGECDFEGVVFSLGAAFEEELAFLGGEEELGSFAGATGEFFDGGDGADVEVGEDDDKFVGGEFFAVGHERKDNVGDAGVRGGAGETGGEPPMDADGRRCGGLGGGWGWVGGARCSFGLRRCANGNWV